MSKQSDEFERVVRAILDDLRGHLGFSHVEGSKRYTGRVSRRRRQIDATAYLTDGRAILVECKLYVRRLKAEVVQAFHYMIEREIGAAGGLLVTTVGYQAAAEAIAHAEQIGTAILNPDATEYDYLLSIAGRLFRRISFTDLGTKAAQITYPSPLPLAPTSITIAQLKAVNVADRSLTAFNMSPEGFTLAWTAAESGMGSLAIEAIPHGYGEHMHMPTVSAICSRQTRLSGAQMAEIRRRYTLAVVALAAEYGISGAEIGRIVRDE